MNVVRPTHLKHSGKCDAAASVLLPMAAQQSRVELANLDTNRDDGKTMRMLIDITFFNKRGDGAFDEIGTECVKL